MPEEKKTTRKSTAAKSSATKAATNNKASASSAADSVANMPAAKKAAKKREKLLKKQNKKPHTAKFWVCLIIIALLVGFFAGKCLFGIMPLGTMSGKTALTEGQLDSVVATYSNKGRIVSVTARDVLDHTLGLESARDGDNYSYPTASDTLEYVQNQVLNEEVQAKGIEVSDEDMDAYANKMLGSTDYDTIAAQYGMSVDNVKQAVREAAGVEKLYNQVTSQDAANAISAPEECPDAEKDVASEKYGQYITHLLGDEWDTKNERWASTSGKYYSDLKDEKFTSKSATYNQAKKAYDIAVKDASSDEQTASKTWTDYIDGILANASIAIGEII